MLHPAEMYEMSRIDNYHIGANKHLISPFFAAKHRKLALACSRFYQATRTYMLGETVMRIRRHLGTRLGEVELPAGEILPAFIDNSALGLTKTSYRLPTFLSAKQPTGLKLRWTTSS